MYSLLVKFDLIHIWDVLYHSLLAIMIVRLHNQFYWHVPLRGTHILYCICICIYIIDMFMYLCKWQILHPTGTEPSMDLRNV
jgi:uncharacterized membrane protein